MDKKWEEYENMNELQSEKRNQLLNHLYTIRQGLSYIYDGRMHLNSLENARRQALNARKEILAVTKDRENTISGRKENWPSYSLFLGLLINAVLLVFFTFFGRELIGYNIGAIFAGVLLSRNPKGKLPVLLKIILVLCLFWMPVNFLGLIALSLVKLDIFAIIIYIVVIFLIVFLDKLLYPKWLDMMKGQFDDEALIRARGLTVQEYQRQINHYGEVQQEKERVENELNHVAQALRIYGDDWYPQDYYYIDAVDFFIVSLKNWKADNIKELVNLYDDTMYKQAQVAYLDEMVRLQKEQNLISNKMAEYLRYNNYIQTEQVTQLESIRLNTAEAAAYLKNLKVNEVHNHHHQHHHQHNHFHGR
ncbi:TPA: hypothetical protein U2B88_001984 [Streptococcus suis]|nr:hypothetical protein [Streptococcus suis]HEM6089917.1 hypothetical protein [Streptococcus suis]